MQETVTILNEEGLHARPAGTFVKRAAQFKSAIEVKANGKSANAKSLMSLMSLGLTQNASVTIVANGADEAQAVQTLAELVRARFATAETN